jgi:hypothetical protein
MRKILNAEEIEKSSDAMNNRHSVDVCCAASKNERDGLGCSSDL